MVCGLCVCVCGVCVSGVCGVCVCVCVCVKETCGKCKGNIKTDLHYLYSNTTLLIFFTLQRHVSAS